VRIGLIAAAIGKNSKGMNVFRRPLARQIEYDFTVDDLISSGSTVEDAIEEANVLFNEEYDTRYPFSMLSLSVAYSSSLTHSGYFICSVMQVT
jgi:hypothetical protein